MPTEDDALTPVKVPSGERTRRQHVAQCTEADKSDI